jgi:DNA modification methylase
MINNLIDAGFDTNFTSLYWAYASGFPKAANVGKLVDKRGHENHRYSELSKELCNYLKTSREQLGLSQKDVAKSFLSKTGGITGCVWNWENGANLPTMEEWNKLKDILKLHNDKFIELIERAISKREEAEREVIASKTKARSEGSNYAMPTLGDKTTYIDIDYTIPATEQAKALDGSYAGYQPKPAVECILVVMKPLSEKTYVDQALSNNKGVTWLDDGRIPYQSESDRYVRDTTLADMKGNNYGRAPKQTDYTVHIEANENGRFPANLLVSDDVLNDGKNYKTGDHTGHLRPANNPGWEGFKSSIGQPKYYKGDEGSFSRYFSLDSWAEKTLPFLICAKASRAEKNVGLEGNKLYKKLEPVIERETKTVRKNEPSFKDIAPYLSEKIYQKYNSHYELAKDLDVHESLIRHWIGKCRDQDLLPTPEYWIKLKQLLGFDDKYDKIMTETIEVQRSETMRITKFVRPRESFEKILGINHHPTVKPIKLMSYLITMGSRPNDLILDPFTGSGTTGIAALQLGRRFVGIELSQEYTEIARKRLKPYIQQARMVQYQE